MLIHVLNISFIYIISYLSVLSCFISYHISYTFHVSLHFTFCSCDRILSSHSSVMLLISCHISYTSHFCILVILLLCFMPANTLEVDKGNDCMYPKVLSLYETVISICMYPKVLSLYETVISICMTQTGPL